MSARVTVQHAATDTRTGSAVAVADGRSGPFPCYRVDAFATDTGTGKNGVNVVGYAYIVKDTDEPRRREWVLAYDHTEAREFHPTLGSAVSAVARTAATRLVPPA